MPDILEPKTKKTSPFTTLKKPDTIIYQMINQNERLRPDTPLYPPYILKKNTDVINYILPEDIKGLGVKGEEIQVAIRYIHGEKSIFVHDQEQNGRTLPENVMHNQKNDIEIVEGHIRVQPSQKTKIQFLDYVSWNEDSPYKSGRVQPIIKKLNEEAAAKTEIERMKLQKEAMQKAFDADDNFMAGHSEILKINLIDPQSNGGRTAEAVRKDYIAKASAAPEEFLRTHKEVKS